jgi:uncharacterized protein YxjI
MNPAFTHSNYLLKRQVFAFTGKLRFFDPQGTLALFVEQKMFRLKEDIRVYSDETKSQEILLIKAAAYDVTDAATGQKVGVLRRKGWSSMVRDEWEVLDVNDQPLGSLIEDSMGYALLRRFLLGSLLPQNYDILFGETRVADLRQKFNPFAYQMMVDFSMDTANRLDRRMGIAGAILLAIIEGKQQN